MKNKIITILVISIFNLISIKSMAGKEDGKYYCYNGTFTTNDFLTEEKIFTANSGKNLILSSDNSYFYFEKAKFRFCTLDFGENEGNTLNIGIYITKMDYDYLYSLGIMILHSPNNPEKLKILNYTSVDKNLTCISNFTNNEFNISCNKINK